MLQLTGKLRHLMRSASSVLTTGGKLALKDDVERFLDRSEGISEAWVQRGNLRFLLEFDWLFRSTSLTLSQRDVGEMVRAGSGRLGNVWPAPAVPLPASSGFQLQLPPTGSPPSRFLRCSVCWASASRTCGSQRTLCVLVEGVADSVDSAPLFLYRKAREHRLVLRAR